MFGDSSQRTSQVDFHALLGVQNLINYVKFPTHSSGSLLDPVLSDLESSVVQCYHLGFVDSSDHIAVLTKVTFKHHREEHTLRTVSRWENANWKNIAKHSDKWTGILCCVKIWTQKQDNSQRF